MDDERLSNLSAVDKALRWITVCVILVLVTVAFHQALPPSRDAIDRGFRVFATQP